MAVTYKYNGVDPFDGLCAPPLFARSEEIVRDGGKTSRVENITLSGELRKTVCNGGFSDTFAQSKLLLLKFAESFKIFQILENGSLVYSHSNAIINSINFNDSGFVDLIPFQINITCYHNDYFTNILEPKEEYNYSEEQNRIVKVIHTISARGIASSGASAIDNARTFIASREGWNNSIAPAPTDFTVLDPILIKRAESIDQLNSSVSLTEEYIFDPFDTSGDSQYVILFYTSETSSSDGITYINISGKLQGSIDYSISSVRSYFNTIDWYNIALSEYVYAFPASSDLEIIPGSLRVTENPDDVSLSFTIGYHNNQQSDPFLIDTTTVTQSFNGVDCMSVSLIIRSIFGCPSERLSKTKAYYNTFDLDAYVANAWSKYGTGRLLGAEKSRSFSLDNATGDISLEVNYCTDNTESCGCLENLVYNISCSPAIPMFGEMDALEGEGCYYIQDLNCNKRAKFSINGSCRPSKCCSNEAVVSQIYSRANQILAQYFSASDIILEADNVEYSQDRSVVSFSFSWNGIQSQQLTDAYVLATF